MLLFHAGHIIADDDDPLVLLNAAEIDNAVDLGDLSRIFRTARFEELGDARQTARDVLRLDRAARQFRKDHTRRDKLPFARRDDGAGRNRIGSDQFAVFRIGIDRDLRMEFAAVLLHDQLDLARLLVDFALGRNPFDEVFVFDIAWAFANDRTAVLLPLADFGLLLHFRAIGKEDLRAEFDGEGLERLDRFVAEELLIVFKRASFVADDLERSVLIEREPMPLFVLNDAQIHVDENAVLLGDELWAEACRCNTAQVEGSHRELRSRFADRLSGDDSNRFAQADEIAGRQVESIAFRADAAAAFASESGADPDVSIPASSIASACSSGQNIAGTGEDFRAVARLIDIIEDRSSIDPVFDREKLFVALLDRCDFDAVQACRNRRG